MKLIQRLSLLASIALVATACDIQQTFDDRINDKQLLVLAPDFADTSVQLVFRDPETLAVLDEDFEVTVYANKRLIDANGNYKNEFIARGGVMEFFVSPEETVSEGDPLEIVIEAISFDQTIEVMKDASISSKNLTNSLILSPSPRISMDEPQGIDISQMKSNNNGANNNQHSISKVATLDLGTTLSFNDLPLADHYETSGVSIRRWWRDAFSEMVDEVYFVSGTTNKPLKVKVTGGVDLRGVYYDLEFRYESNGLTYDYYLTDYGYYGRRVKNKQDKTLSISYGELSNYENSFLLEDGIKPKMFYLNAFNIGYIYRCNQGFNLKIEGLASGNETNLIYKATRSDNGDIFAIASFNVDNPLFNYNSLRDGGVQNYHFINYKGNTLEFAENAQYYIEPQMIELGGEELCGNTYTVKLIPRENHSKYNLNLSMRCEEDEVGVAPTFSALYRKKGGDEASWETVSFKKGSTSLYLEEGAVYEVKGTFSDRAFEFEFTNEASKIAEAVSGTRNGNTAVKDITYTIESGDTGSQSINANVVFYAADCLIN